MTLQTAKYSNFFETTLDGAVGASDTNMTLTAAPTDGASNISAPYYLVLDPDSVTKREVVLVTGSSGTTLSAVTRDVEGRHSPDPSHADDVTVRMAVVGEMFEDLHDRLNDVALTGDVTGTISSSTQDIATTIGASSVQVGNIDFLVDEDNMSSNSAVKVPTQQSVKAYADTMLPKAGGTLSGGLNAGDQQVSALVLKDYAELEIALGTTTDTSLEINLANGNCGTVTLAHNIADIDFTNVPTDFATFTLVVAQDGTGSRTMAINQITVNADSHQAAKTAGGAGLTLSTAASSVDIITFLFVNEAPYLFSQLAFA
jgi:hypothetical protein